MTGSSGYIPYMWMDGRKMIAIGTPARKKKNNTFLVQLLCSCHFVFSSFIIRTCQLFESFSSVRVQRTDELL